MYLTSFGWGKYMGGRGVGNVKKERKKERSKKDGK
jgi:hypothetical protein